MKFILSLFAFLAMPFLWVQAESSEADSLMIEVELAAVDSAKVDLCLRIARTTIFTDKDTAIHYLRIALSTAQEIGYVNGEATASRWMGIAYILQDAYALALDRYFKAAALFDSVGNDFGKGRVLGNIATVYMSQGDYGQAIEQLEESLVLAESVGDTLAFVNGLHNLGVCYDETGEPELALEQFERTRQLKLDAGMENQLAMTLNSIGEVYLKQDRLEDVRPYLEEAIQLKRKYEDPRGEGIVSLNFAEYHLKKNQLDSVELYLLKGLELVRSQNSRAFEGEYLKWIADLRDRQGRPQEAYENLLAHIAITDSLNDETNKRTIANLQAAYEFDQKEREISLLAAENDIKEADLGMQRFFIVFLVLGLLVVSLFLILYLRTARHRKRSNEQLQAYNQKIEEQNTQIAEQNHALKQKNKELEESQREQEGMLQMIVHDLKAPLNKSLMLAELVRGSGELNEDQAKGVRMIKDVCEQGGQLIDDLISLQSAEQRARKSEPNRTDLFDLVHRVAAGFQGYAGSKSIVVHTPSETEGLSISTDTRKLKRVLDNLLSNAIKFSPHGARVFLKVSKQENGALLSVRDEGPGFTAEDRDRVFGKFQRLSAQPTGGESSTGLGLAIVQVLVEQLGGRLSLISEPGKGAEFQLSLSDMGDAL